jgi:DNA-binding NarL/FixJ family response regulator
VDYEWFFSSLLDQHLHRRVVNPELLKAVFMANSDTCDCACRVLLVDDFEPWRLHVCAVLEARPGVHVVGHVADGLEAVQKAQELKPDPILLDIGLPNLNGIEAAERIRTLAPDIKIIFLTQEREKDLVRTALSTGAQGYVLKTDVGRELLTAVAEVLGSGDFVGSGIRGGDTGENDRF